jgi:hypothetical protein
VALEARRCVKRHVKLARGRALSGAAATASLNGPPLSAWSGGSWSGREVGREGGPSAGARPRGRALLRRMLVWGWVVAGRGDGGGQPRSMRRGVGTGGWGGRWRGASRYRVAVDKDDRRPAIEVR